MTEQPVLVPGPDYVATVDTTEPVRAVRKRRRLPNLRRWISTIVLVLLWQGASAIGWLPPNKLSSPWTILGTARALIADGELGSAFLVSLQRVAIGFTLGLLIGVVLGAIAGLSKWGDSLLDPPVQMLRTLPFLGLIPLFILWFGIGETPKIALIALGVAFPLYVNVHAGIRGTDRGLLEASRVLGFTRWQRLRHVVLPSAASHTLVGLRLGIATAWLSLIVGEQINASSGLGYMINNARDFLRTDIVLVGLLVYALLGLTTDAGVRLLERWVLRWRNP
jgi:sulfonate transport system permease protein